MLSSDTSEVNRRAYNAAMPPPEIPTRHTNWFMKALWLLALLLVVGVVYSFWRISTVASPTLDVPPITTDNAQGR